MERRGLLSRHVTFTSENTQYPSYALILIEGARIADIIAFSPQVSPAEVEERFSEWNVEDLSDYYICPGIIDINVRREYEDLYSMTQAAIAGGVTFILEEPGIYTRETDAGELFCDVGKVSHYDEIEEGSLAIKGYLYPPSYMRNHLQFNLDEVFTKVAEYDLPLIIDPNLPYQRNLYVASPYRHESLEVRFGSSKPVQSSLFAAAIPESIPRSDSESSGEEFTIKTRGRRVTTQDNQIRNSLAFPDEERSISFDNVQETASPCKDMPEIPEEDESPKKKRTIYDDLDTRIKNFSQTIEALSLAEQFTYQNSGVTSYSRRSRSFNNTINTDNEESPSPSLAERKKRLLDLAPIKTQVETVSQETSYAFHLANFPEHWETAGLDVILDLCKEKSLAVHICNISSAQALNQVRQAKMNMKNLTSEVGAPHLFFTSEAIANKDTRMKTNCVIRNSTNYQLIWDILKLKGIDCITSQHANIDAQFKDLERGNFQLALNGINSIGFAMQAVWTSLAKTATGDELEHYLVRLSKWMSKRPAEIIQIADHRGSIEKGKFADLVIWKPYQSFCVEELYSANPETSPFYGLQMYGKIDRVYLRGKVAFCQGQFKAAGQKVHKK